MIKLVNITSKVAIRTVTPKICGTHKNILMSTGDILRCICMRAHVEEILPDGSTIVLNSTNYNKDNTGKIHYIIADEMMDITTDNEKPCDVDDTCAIEIEDVVQDDSELIDDSNIEVDNKEVTINIEGAKSYNNHNGSKKNKNKKKK